VIAGGACAFNPEPMAEFFDLFVIGEAEEALLEIVSTCQRVNVSESKHKRQNLLREIAGIEGVYVPAFYDVQYNPDNTISSVKPKYEGVAPRVRKRFIADFDAAFCPIKPVVPFQSIIHDRAVLEILRGCCQGCRFCQAGMITRPARARSEERARELIQELMSNTGWEEISLLALNACDFPGIEGLVSWIAGKYSGKGISISLPSLRPGSFSVKLARLISMGMRVRPTLTFAPEAGTQRLRDSINKGVSEKDLFESTGSAFNSGWDSCKLYFMIGLPGETGDDLKGIVDLARELRRPGQRVNPKASLRLSISSFVPKPHTPFQWEPQDGIGALKEKQQKLLLDLRKTEVRWSRPEMSYLEGIFARGDRRLGRALFYAWKSGAQVDAQEEKISGFAVWEDAFQKAGTDPAFYLYRKREYGEVLPWDHIDTLVSKDFLVSESRKAKEGIVTPNCISGECNECGACESKQPSYVVRRTSDVKDENIQYLRASSIQLPADAKQRFRVKYSRGEELKYISHLDLQRLLARALRRAEIPFAFSKSFHSLPLILPGVPLSVGMLSDCELCDVLLSERMELGEFAKRFSSQMPRGIELKEAQEIMLAAPAIVNAVRYVRYEIKVKLQIANCKLQNEIQELLKKNEIMVRRKTPKVDKTVNIRPGIESIELSESGLNGCVILDVLLKMMREGQARPDEVAGALLPGVGIAEIKRTEIIF